MATKAQVQTFIEKLAALAIKECNSRTKKVLPSICIAQAALETGWGTSGLMTKAHAYFGIKAGSSWKGKVYSSKTGECYDGVNYTTITAVFRAYDSVEESVKDYYDLITGASRYAGAVGATDPTAAITAIKNGGYATSPTYIKNVMNIVNGYGLHEKYDSCMTGSAGTSAIKAASVTEESTKAKTHTVVKGDTLTKIAKNNSTTIEKIVAANKAKYPKITANFIAIGWKLTV